MKIRTYAMLAMLGVAGLALSPPDVLAKPPAARSGKKGAAPKAGPGPSKLQSKIALAPEGLHFGIGIDELSRVYAKAFEKEFVPLYQRAEPGPQQKELDEELENKKGAIKRSKLAFGSLPSGLDGTPLGAEFTYNNGEAMAKVQLRSGTMRHFFFFGDSLWKVYDIHALGKKKQKKWGNDFAEVVEHFTKALGGVKPRVLEADPSKGRGRERTFADWSDGSTIYRIIDLGSKQVATVYIDQKVEEQISKFRKNDAESDKAKLDSDVADVTSSKPSEDK